MLYSIILQWAFLLVSYSGCFAAKNSYTEETGKIH